MSRHDNLVQEVQVVDMITDHHLLLCNVHHLQKTKIITRAFCSIDLSSFRTDISQGLGIFMTACPWIYMIQN